MKRSKSAKPRKKEGMFDLSLEKFPYPDVRNVVYAIGTNREMGFQCGFQLAEYLSHYAKIFWSKCSAFESKDKIVKRLREHIGVIEKLAPEILDFTRGVAQGASGAGLNMRHEDVLITIWHWNLIPPILGACSSFGAWGGATENGEPIFAQNLDDLFYPTFYDSIIVYFPKGGNAFAMMGFPGVGGNNGMNAKGLVVSTQWNPTRDEDRSRGWQETLVVYWLLQNAGSVEEAKELIEEIPVAEARNYVLMDGGQACVVEATPSKKLVRRPGENGEKDFIVTTNHFNSKGWEGRYDIPNSPEHFNFNSWTRYMTIFKKVEENHGSINPDIASEIMSSHEYWNGKGWVKAGAKCNRTPCVIDLDREGEIYCTGSHQVFMPRHREFRFVQGPPCEGLSPVFLGAKGYVKIAFEKSPSGMNELMRKDAAKLIVGASELVCKGLDGEMRQKIESALKHYVEGKNAELSAGDSGALFSLACLSRAASRFARAQAYARYAILKARISSEQLL